MSLAPYKITALKPNGAGFLRTGAGAIVSIEYPSGGLIPLYSDDLGTPMTNPFACDANGEKEIWANSGQYVLNVVDGGSWDIQIAELTEWDTDSNAYREMYGKPFFVKPNSTVNLIIPADFATVNLALTAIARWVIPNNSLVRILLPQGHFSYSNTVVANHPYGARISVEGIISIFTTASASGAVTGSVGAWNVPLTVASSAGMSVDDYLIIRGVTGTGQFVVFSGLCKITNIAGNIVTVRSKVKLTSWPTASLSTANITCVRTTLTFTGMDGFQIDSALGNIDNMVIVGNKSPGTIGVIASRTQTGLKNKAYVRFGPNTGVTSFGDGNIYAQYGGTVDARYLATADANVYNVLAQHGGSIDINDGISSGSDQAGIAATSSGDVSCERCVATGNVVGLYSIQGGSILSVNSAIWSNVTDGVFCSWGGSVRGQLMDIRYNNTGLTASGGFAVIPTSFFQFNTLTGVYVEGGGNVVATGSTMSDNGQFGVYCDGGAFNGPNATASNNGINGFTAINNGTILINGGFGSNNAANFASATRNGTIRATNCTIGNGSIIFADSNGLVDLTASTGTLNLSYNSEGKIFNQAGTLVGGSMLLDGGSRLAIGATNTAAVNIDKLTAIYARLAKNGVLKTLFGIDDGSALIAGAADGDTILRAAQAIWFAAGGANERGFIDANGNAALGRASLGTAATDGFFYIPSCAGVPTGTPAAKTGRVPLVADNTNNKIYAYLGGAWVSLN